MNKKIIATDLAMITRSTLIYASIAMITQLFVSMESAISPAFLWVLVAIMMLTTDYLFYKNVRMIWHALIVILIICTFAFIPVLSLASKVIMTFALIATVISKHYYEAHGLGENSLILQIIIGVILVICEIAIDQLLPTGLSHLWMIEITIAIAINMVGIGILKNISIFNQFLGIAVLGSIIGLSIACYKPLCRLVVFVSKLIKNSIGPIVKNIVFFVYSLLNKGPSVRTDSDISAGENMSIIGSGMRMNNSLFSRIMGWIFIGFVTLLLVYAIYLLIRVVILWLLRSKGRNQDAYVSAKGNYYHMGLRKQITSILLSIKEVYIHIRASLILKKHPDSIGYLLVFLEKKYKKDEILSRKPYETPIEFVKKLGFSGDDIQRIERALYSKDMNLL